jgi:hypothetical protein
MHVVCAAETDSAEDLEEMKRVFLLCASQPTVDAENGMNNSLFLQQIAHKPKGAQMIPYGLAKFEHAINNTPAILTASEK